MSSYTALRRRDPRFTHGPTARRRSEDESWLDETGNRRRNLIVVLVAVQVLLAILLILLDRAAGEEGAEGAGTGGDAEPGTSVRLSAAEPGTRLAVSAEGLPRTSLQVTGRDAVAAQTVVVLDERVLFDFDRSVLRSDAAGELDRLADLVLASSDGAVDVTGYTDALGSDEYNAVLSQERAEAVVAYLVSQGVAGERLRPGWRGEEDPVEPNSEFFGGDNPEGRAQNRRVEVAIDGDGAPLPPPPASALGSDQHPDGTVLAVDAVTVEPKGVVVDARVSNRAVFPVELADEPVWLVDDTGAAYRMQPTWQNPRVAVASGATVRARMAFLGTVPPGATRFTLMTNVEDPAEGVDTSRRRDSDATPSMIVTGIPRP